MNIDSTTYVSPAINLRYRGIVLHYTAGNFEQDVNILAGPNAAVSSHFLVSDREGDPVYQLTPLEKRAWHAGVSQWAGFQSLNDSTVGIEISHLGYRDEAGKRVWYPFPEWQIRQVGELVRKLIDDAAALGTIIHPHWILGHSDIACGRKVDPGVLFPWELLYREYGIGMWVSEGDAEYCAVGTVNAGDIAAVQRTLRTIGYHCGPVDGLMGDQTRHCIAAFNARFLQQESMEMSDEGLRRAQALVKKYALTDGYLSA